MNEKLGYSTIYRFKLYFSPEPICHTGWLLPFLGTDSKTVSDLTSIKSGHTHSWTWKSCRCNSKGHSHLTKLHFHITVYMASQCRLKQIVTNNVNSIKAQRKDFYMHAFNLHLYCWIPSLDHWIAPQTGLKKKRSTIFYLQLLKCN